MINRRPLLAWFLILACFFADVQTRAADNGYLWPTDASKSLTSTFGEYRARRFHTGIDIRTRGRTGFKCFAVRSGYVWRISVSPYGYGKAVYLKLDTGEVAVYAHLSKFSDALQKYVDAEQERTGKYRVNIFLKSQTLPVVRGQVIAYTGQTGIGAPHLHFEIRDASNRPTNPLLKGYRLPDRIAPIVRKLSFTPLDTNSEVDGDYRPLVVTPQWERSGQYFVPEPVSVWGNVGIGVSSYDKSRTSSNRYGVYSLTLFVDDVQRFHYSYDRISFKNNPMVELERDYRLSRRNLGRFYKLYKDRFNLRTPYVPNKTWAGVLSSAPLNATPALSGGAAANETQATGTLGSLFPGLHEFRVEISDFFGNVSTVSGKLSVGPTFDIHPVITEDDDGALTLKNVLTFDLNRVEEVNAFIFKGRRWEQLPFDWTTTPSHDEEKGGDAVTDDAFETADNVFIPAGNNASPLILRFESRDQFGAGSYPYYFVRAAAEDNSLPPQIQVDYDYYNDYVRLELTSNNILGGIPVVTLYPGRWDAEPIALHQTSLKSYVGRIDLSHLNGTEHPLLITLQNLNGEQYSVIEQCEAERIRPRTADRIFSRDKKLWVNFSASSLYDPIYTRVEIDSASSLPDLEVSGPIYRIDPRDVLLKKGAVVHLQYADTTARPEKLGVYYKTRRGKWAFIDNIQDEASRSISARVLSFEEFALIRDEVPPEISKIRPADGAHILSGRPRISVVIQDALSGIRSENDLELRLDGQKLIAEYDPERNRLVFQTREALSKGRHHLMAMAMDKCHNVAVRESSFWIE